MKNYVINFSLAVMVVLTVFSLWYKTKYSMGIIYPYEINNKECKTSVLIATQESIYKDQLTCSLIDGIADDDMYLKVIDITGLNRINQGDFDVIFIIHTWEMWRPPSIIKSFISTLEDKSKIYTIGTSGAGDLTISGVDGVSAASEINNTIYVVGKAVQWFRNRTSVSSDQTYINYN